LKGQSRLRSSAIRKPPRVSGISKTWSAATVRTYSM